MMLAWRTTLFTVKGLRQFMKDGFEKSAKHFDASDLEVDLKGRCALVTGANQGIGYQTATALAKRGATVLMVCRSAERGEAARKAIVAATGNTGVTLAVADLSLVSAVAKVASDYTASGAPLHILVNNAGCLVDPRTDTKEGLETNFATNTLAVFALTEALLPVLRRSSPSRVVVVSSGGQYTEALSLTDMQWKSGSGFSGARQYARDKRRQTALTERWGRDPANAGVFFASCHPGWADTDAVRTSLPQFYESLKPKLRTPEQGADTPTWLAIAPLPKLTTAVPAGTLANGAFWFDRRRVSTHLTSGGTSYPNEVVDTLHKNLEDLVAATLKAAAPAAAAAKA